MKKQIALISFVVATLVANASVAKKKVEMLKIVDGLEYTEEKIGTGDEAKPGKTVVVHYTGWLIKEGTKTEKGTQFDSSRSEGRTPFEFPLGGGRVIQGWDKGFAGMKIGGKRTLYLAPEMGYGTRGAPPVIPPNAKLMFEVELLGLK